MDPRTFRMPILTLSIVGIQPTLMERLLLDRQLLGHRLNPLKIEIEIYQLQRQRSPLLRMRIPTQIELLVIMLLVGHLFIFSFFIHLNSVLNRKFLLLIFSFNTFTLTISLSEIQILIRFIILLFRSISWTRNFWKSSFRHTLNNWRKSGNKDSRKR